MQLAWSPEDEAFRTDLIAFLDEHTPAQMATGFDFQDVGDERDQIDHAERPGDDETAQPVVGSREPVRDCDLPNIGRRTTCMISSLSNWVDSDREHQDFQDRCRMACRADS